MRACKCSTFCYTVCILLKKTCNFNGQIPATLMPVVDRNNDRTFHGTELYNIYSSVPYFSTSHGIEFTVNDRKIFYGLIPLSFMVCKRINYFFLKECMVPVDLSHFTMTFPFRISKPHHYQPTSPWMLPSSVCGVRR